MERKIIGYTLKKEKYAEEACKIEGYRNFGMAIRDCAFINLKGREEGFRRLATSGKLDELFNSVYEGDSYKVGSFSLPPLSYKEELPDKWYIRITSDNSDKLKEWWVKNNPNHNRWSWVSAKYLLSKHKSDTSMLYNNDRLNLNYYDDYTEITAEQLLNQSKEMKTYKVTREQLAEIYSIACGTWKPKIGKITNDALGAFNTEGELSEEIVQSMRDAATTEQRPVIDRIFPKPKKMVTKEAVGYVNIYKGGAFGLVRDTKGEAMANARNALVVAHEIRIPYEVEEEC